MTNLEHHGGRRWRMLVTVALLFFIAIIVYSRLYSTDGSDQSEMRGPQNALFAAALRSADGQADQLAVAHELRKRGNAAAALAYEQAAADAAGNLDLWRHLAKGYAARGHWVGVQALWTQVLQRDPLDPEALYELALLELPSDARASYELLASLVDDPQYGEIAAQLRTLIAAVELEPPAYQSFRFGQALAVAERWEQAAQAFHAAIALDPDYAEVWAYLGFVRAMAGRSPAGAVEQGLVLAPQSSLVWLMAGLAWGAQAEIDNAMQAVLTAQVLDPQNPAIALELGHLYRQAGDLVLAEYWLQAGANLAGDDDNMFVQRLAMFYAEESYNLEGAGLATLRDAVARRPLDYELLAAYGWALFNAGDPETALDQVNASLAIAPDNPYGLYYEGLILTQTGEVELATIAFETVLGLDDAAGFDTLARRALAELD